MLLSLLGNIVSLIIFLHRPSHYRQSTNSAFYSSLRTRSTRVTRSAEDEQPEIASRRIVAKQDCDHRRGMVTRVNFALPHYSGCSPSSFNHYLASLAVSDLLMAIFCIPFTFTQICLGYWPFNYLLCPMVVYAQLVMVTASSLTNTAISLNRLVGVINPMRRKRWNTDSFFCRTSCRLVFIWGVALVGSSVQLVVTRVHTELGLSVCQEAWFGDVQSRGIYTVVLFLVIYAGPLGVQGATYGFISYRLWRRATPGERIRSMEDARLKEKKRVLIINFTYEIYKILIF
ncbi:unnamed protein product [Calicophoron daubneyi]|uniref:G-protein coupled receptors family 1 profile domain-containing protein n=1 Tax=Calicophoron daubneyi TaxID=300641 RepID=A0AAV2TFG1_CALDB